MLMGQALIADIDAYTPQEGACAFWWLGQMTFVVKTARHTLYFDLYLSDSPARLFPPPLRAEEVCNANLFFGSHDHDDHIDYPTWHTAALASPDAKLVVPGVLIDSLAHAQELPRCRYLAAEDGARLTVDGVEIRCIAAAHERLNPVNGRYANMIYVVRVDGVTLCHVGDSCVYDGLLSRLRALGPIDLMFLPINGRDAKRLRRGCIGNMTYQEAVDLVGEVQPRLAVPAHYDMFENNSENPALFAGYLEIKYPERDFWMGPHARRVELPSNAR